MHICFDEVFAFLSVFPLMGYFVLRGRHLWHRIFRHKVEPVVDGCCPPGHKHPRPHHLHYVLMVAVVVALVVAGAYLETR